jgi:hypothetical protein
MRSCHVYPIRYARVLVRARRHCLNVKPTKCQRVRKLYRREQQKQQKPLQTLHKQDIRKCLMQNIARDRPGLRRSAPLSNCEHLSHNKHPQTVIDLRCVVMRYS